MVSFKHPTVNVLDDRPAFRFEPFSRLSLIEQAVRFIASELDGLPLDQLWIDRATDRLNELLPAAMKSIGARVVCPLMRFQRIRTSYDFFTIQVVDSTGNVLLSWDN